MYGGYYVDQGPAGYHNSALYSDPRIAVYIGMGMRQMPGDVWWRTWRTLPPSGVRPTRTSRRKASSRRGSLADLHRSAVGEDFNVWEGHYVYPGTSLTFVPTFAGGMFEA